MTALSMIHKFKRAVAPSSQAIVKFMYSRKWLEDCRDETDG